MNELGIIINTKKGNAALNLFIDSVLIFLLGVSVFSHSFISFYSSFHYYFYFFLLISSWVVIHQGLVASLGDKRGNTPLFPFEIVSSLLFYFFSSLSFPHSFRSSHPSFTFLIPLLSSSFTSLTSSSTSSASTSLILVHS